jgi:hypothetical protein
MEEQILLAKEGYSRYTLLIAWTTGMEQSIAARSTSGSCRYEGTAEMLLNKLDNTTSRAA